MRNTTGVWLQGLGARALRLRQRAHCSVQALRGSLRSSAAAGENGTGKRSNGKRHLERLEPRILLSADPLSASLDSLVNHGHDYQDTLGSAYGIDQLAGNLATAYAADSSATSDQNPTPNNNSTPNDNHASAPALDLAQLTELLAANQLAESDQPDASPESGRHEIIFVDTATPDYQDLIDSIVSNAVSDYQIVEIDSNSDGIAIISDYLSGVDDIDAVHLVSHGSAGGVQLGSSWLDQDSLGQFAALIDSWSAGLNSDADLLIYGCNLAADASGQDLLEALAQLTGADVAASDDLTGSADLGGDWVLEFQLGSIETIIPFTQATAAGWSGVLVVHYADNFDSIGYSNSDGAVDWSGDPWVETGDNGSAVSGDVLVTTVGVDQGLQISGGNETVYAIKRSVDHIGGDYNNSFQLRFDQMRTGFNDGNDKVTLQLSTDGFNWQNAYTWSDIGAGFDPDPTSLSFAITNYSTDSTWFRFITDVDMSAGASLFIDNVEVTFNKNTLWLSTTGDEGSSGAPGLGSWNKSAVINFEPSSTGLGTQTDGSLGWLFDIENFTGGTNIDALHYVTRDISVGTGTPVNLKAGDVLLSLDSTENLNGTGFNSLWVTDDDVFRFRPDTPGDYSSGTFAKLFRSLDGENITGVTLVEHTTVVGSVDGTELQQGTFLYTSAGANQYNIIAFEPGDLSVFSNTGDHLVLLDGTEEPYGWPIFEAKPVGIDLLENALTIGGETWAAGTILLTMDADGFVELNTFVNAKKADIVALNLTQTVLNSASTQGNVSMFFDGSDVGLSSASESLDAISLYWINSAPTGSVTINGSVMEDQTLTADTSGLADPDGLGSFSYQWLRDGTPVGAGNSTYILDDADVGALMSVEVSYTDDGGTAEQVSSAETSAVVNVNDAPVFTTNALSPTYTEDGAAVKVFASTVIDTVEAGDRISGFVLSVDNVNDALEYLNIDDVDISLVDGVSGATTNNSLSYSVSVTGATATITLSGGAMTTASAEGVFNGIAYRNASNDPNTTNRTVTVTSITDSGGTANGGVDTLNPAGMTATVTVVATNDQPLAGALSIVADEDGSTVSDSFAVTDADSGDSHLFDIVSSPAEGSVVNNGDGTFTFDPGADFQDLAAGETRDASFKYTATDSSGAANATSVAATVTVTVTGTNDQPVAGAVSINATEDGAAVTDSFAGSDADSSDVYTFAITSSPSEGSVINNNDGTFTFDPGADFQDLAAGETRAVNFNYTVSDDSGQGNATSSDATVTVTVTGSNDRPTAVAVAINADEDGSTVSNGFVLGGDADASDNHSFSITSGPSEGSVINNNDGTFTFDPGSDFQDLAEGETRDVIFNYTAIDDSGAANAVSTGATVTVTVLGKNNDAPTFDVSALNPTYSVGGNGVNIFSNTAIDTIESSDTVTGFVLSVDNVVDVADEILNIDGTDITLTDGTSGSTGVNGLTFNIGVSGSTATVTITGGSMSAAVAEDLFDNITYRNTNLSADLTDRAVTVTSLTDSGGTNNGGVDTVAPGLSGTVSISPGSVNNQPVANPVAIAAAEDGATVTDNFAVSDADVGDSHIFTITSSPAEGSVINNNDGSFTFDPGSDFQDLAAGETRDVTFNFTATDDSGLGNATSTSATVTVTVTGTNDQPTAVAIAIDADEDGSAVSDSFVLGADVDTSDAHSFSITGGPAEGSVVNNNDGTFTFDPGTDFQDLADGETRDVTFTYAAVDNSGQGNASSANATVTVTVTGANDRPVASAVGISAAEDGSTVSDNFVLGSDADTTDGHSFAITSSPAEGSVINNNDGTFTFNPGTDFQDLAEGETRDVSFTYTATDDSATGNATSSAATVTVTVTGTNDQPTASAVNINADEDGATVTDSFVLGGDIDSADSHSFTITSAPTEGSVVNNNDGTFTFDPGSDFQDLADGETRDVTFTYTATDDSASGNATSASATVTVTVTGSNDQPTASAVFISADEDGAAVTDSFVLGGDADTTDSHSFTITSSPTEGSVVNNNDGTFTFDPGADFQDLGDGETRAVTFTYTATDDTASGNATSTAATVTVTVTGSNDQPLASAVSIDADEEGGTVTDNFVLGGDADTTDSHSFTITSSPTEGSVVNNNDGTFTFDPGTDFQDLGEGEARDVTFTYTATDDSATGNATSSAATVTVTVTGTNDQPTASAVNINADEDGATVSDSFVFGGDADATDSHSFTITSSPAEGSVVNNNDGTFTFDPGTDFQDLGDGETRAVSFTYTATDDSGTGSATSSAATVTVTVTGTNDQPTASAVNINADEDGATVSDSFVLGGDADATDSHSFTITSSPAEGSVVNNNDGTFTFDPGTDFQDLADGETRVVTFTYTATDDSAAGNATSTAATVTVTVTGTNDQPTASAVNINAGEDGATVSDSFVLGGDADATDSHSFTITSSPAEGSVVNNNDGTFTFDPGTDFQDLADGETRVVTFTYTATDDSAAGNATSTAATVTVTVTGTNDQPTASAVNINAGEDGAAVTNSFVLGGDADSSNTHSFTITSSPAEGSVVNNNDGTFTFDPGTDFQDLADGETRDVTFTYTATDDSATGSATSTAATVTITVTGSNDQPIASAVSIYADEDGATVSDSFVLGGDADTTDSHSFTITSSPAEGSVVNNNDGTFTFDPGTDFQDLADGETRVVTFTYTATDDSAAGNAASTAATVTVTVTGTNDQPTASAVNINAGEDGAAVTNSFVLGGDADSSNTHSFTITSSPAEGSVVNNNNGTFTFDPGTDFQDLADGETRDVTFTYTATDDSATGSATSTAATVTITVTGSNDQPIASAVSINADEDGAAVTDSFVLGGDADSSDTHSFTITSSPAEGSVVNNNDGTFTFDPGTDFQDLADGETRVVTFTYTATDDSAAGNATSTAATVTVTVTGTNDQPTASAVNINAGEDGAAVTNSFVLGGDADSSNTHSFTITSSPAEGSVVNNNDGTFTFDPGTDFQDLADGETRDVTFTYTATDDSATGSATSTAATVTITVTGSNDQPIASAVSIYADEDGATVSDSFVLGGDADTTDSHSFTITSSPAEGSVVNNNDGTFTFDPGTDFQDLADGETRVVTFTYTATDDSAAGNAASTAATVTVTVTGTNDQPTASAVNINADEDGATVSDSFVLGGDADATDSHSFTITSSPAEGSVVNNNDGTFTFDPGTDFQDLADGETRVVTFTYTATDDSAAGNAASTAATVTVTVTGTNDQPTASAVNINADEDGATVSDSFVLGGDADATDSHSFTITSSPAEGSVVNNNDGTFTFDPGTDFQDLADGETRAVSFTYITTDDSGTGSATSSAATVTVTVTGTNDQPTASAVNINADEDGATVTDSFVLGGDIDSADSHSFTITSAPTEGSVVNNNDGTFTFDPGTDFQDLGDGETRAVTFTYTVADDSVSGNATSTAATVTVTVTGSNDQPMASAVSISADEDGAAVTDSFVLAGDIDAADTHIFAITSAPAEGSVVNNNDGTFTFDPGSDFQDLAAGETRDVTFTYIVSDNSTSGSPLSEAATSSAAIVTVTVTGSNDQPQVSALTLSAETSNISVNGSFSVSDADLADSHQFLIVSQPAKGVLVNNGDGTFTFNLNNEFKDLKVGAETSVTFTYTAADDSGSRNDTANIKTVVINLVNNSFVAANIELPVEAAAPPEDTVSDTNTGKDNGGDTEEGDDEKADDGQPIAAENTSPADLISTEEGPPQAPLIDIDNNIDISFTTEFADYLAPNDKLQVLVASELAAVESMQKQFALYNEPLELVKSDGFMRQLDHMRDLIDQQTATRDNVVGSAFGVSAGLTAGYVVWLARSGVLLSSLMSSLPMWRFIDPLPILGSTQIAKLDDDESLESMVAATEVSESDAIREGETQ